MILLGTNEDHNATAAIIRNGAVLACASEERFTRTKNDTGYPKKAIDSVLEVAGISCEEIDFVLSGTIISDPVAIRLKTVSTFKIEDYLREMHEYWKVVLIEGRESEFWDVLLQEDRFKNLDGSYYDFSFLESTSREKWASLTGQKEPAGCLVL